MHKQAASQETPPLRWTKVKVSGLVCLRDSSKNPRQQVLADNRSTRGCARASEARADLGSAAEEHPGCRSCTTGQGGG